MLSDRVGDSGGELSAGRAPRRLTEEPAEHVLSIAGDIGPRKPTSLAEAKAAAYLDVRMRRSGMLVVADAFGAAALPGYDGILLALLALLAAVSYFWLPVPALLLLLVCLVVALASPRDDALVVLRGGSQNVVATRAVEGLPARRLVLLAPLDSPSAAGRGAALLTAWSPLLRRIAVVVLVALGLLGTSGVGFELQRLAWYVQLVAVALLLVLAGAELLVHLTGATPGAASHAGGLAVLIGATNALTGLQRTELWAVGVGAAPHAGLHDLLRRYPFDQRDTLFVGLEGIGRGQLCYLLSEGQGRQQPADAQLVELARVAGADPQVGAQPRSYGGATLASALRERGLRTLTITCLDAGGAVPLRHSAADVPETIDADLLARAVRLVVALAAAADAS